MGSRPNILFTRRCMSVHEILHSSLTLIYMRWRFPITMVSPLNSNRSPCSRSDLISSTTRTEHAISDSCTPRRRRRIPAHQRERGTLGAGWLVHLHPASLPQSPERYPHSALQGRIHQGGTQGELLAHCTVITHEGKEIYCIVQKGIFAPVLLSGCSHLERCALHFPIVQILCFIQRIRRQD